MDSILMNESKDIVGMDQEESRFEVTDDRSAEWAMRRIAEKRADTAKWEAHYSRQMESIRKKNQDGEAYLTALLMRWFEIQPKRETKTQAKVALPCGDLVRRSQEPKYQMDDELLAECLISNGMNKYVTHVPKVNWKDLKKTCTVQEDGSVADLDTGLILQGIYAEARPDKFEVKIRESMEGSDNA